MTKKKKEFAVTDFEASKWINYLCNGYYDGKFLIFNKCQECRKEDKKRKK